MKKVHTLIICIAIPLILGAFASLVTIPNIKTWYIKLNKPFFSPPNWVFAPVWTILYIFIGVSFFLVIFSPKAINKNTAIVFAVVQMLLNTLWSFLFFQYHLLSIALVDILLLWIFILGMIRAYYPINKTASLLQIPYLIWVSFATILNAAYLYLNP
jgi:translocator protein